MADLGRGDAGRRTGRSSGRTHAPNNAVLAHVGDIDPEQTLAWVQKYFGSIPAHDGKVPPRDGHIPDIIGREVREEFREEVPGPRA